jgi:hypothetical protein
LEVDSTCPFNIYIDDFDLSLSTNGQPLATTQVPAFQIGYGKNIIQIDSAFDVLDNANYSNLHSIVEGVSNGTPPPPPFGVV